MTTAFQHPYLQHKDGIKPAMLGPVFYMENRLQKTLTDFHYALQQEWGDINLIYGSDEEPGKKIHLRTNSQYQIKYCLHLIIFPFSFSY